MRRLRCECARRDLVHLARVGNDLAGVVDERSGLIRQAARLEAACLHTAGPATLAETTSAR